jgi:hypothetical protein
MLEAWAAQESGSQICVAYVYIRYSDSAEMTVRSVLEVLVRQTIERHPAFLPLVHQVYAQHLREGTQPTEAQLLGLLCHFTRHYEPPHR